jgi:hypothetical protein
MRKLTARADRVWSLGGLLELVSPGTGTTSDNCPDNFE